MLAVYAFLYLNFTALYTHIPLHSKEFCSVKV